MAITESRDYQKDYSKNNAFYTSTMDSGQRKRYIRSVEKNTVALADIPKNITSKWIKNKKIISKFIDDLDYNNQIQSSYDLTLLERQSKGSQRDAA